MNRLHSNLDSCARACSHAWVATSPAPATRPSSRLRRLVGGFAVLLAAACGGPPPAGDVAEGSPIPLPVPEGRPSDGLLTSPELQRVVDLQVARDGAGLRALLQDPDARVRARVAFALGSVQDLEARGDLERLLDDPEPRVRADAAFALGQIELPDEGALLADALDSETVSEVRVRLIEALGKRGGEAAVARLLAVPGDDEPDHDAEDLAVRRASTLALARAGLRDVRPQGLIGTLIDRLADPDPRVRVTAAYYFGRAPNPDAWRAGGDRVREALDGYPPDEPAAMYLVDAVGRLVDAGRDGERLVHWLRSADDWRTRVNVLGIFASPVWMNAPGISEAFLEALDDSSSHVRYAAAGGAAMILWNEAEPHRWALDLLDGPPEEWRVQARLLSPLAGVGLGERLLEWTRRMAEHHPVATVRGVEALGGFSGSGVTDLLFELTEHEEPLVRAAAVRSLSQRWTRQNADEEEVRRYLDLLGERVLDEAALPAARAAQALAHPGLQPLGSAALLEAAWEHHHERGDGNVLIPILEAMGPASVPLLREVTGHEDPRIRDAAAESIYRITGSPPPGFAVQDLGTAVAPVPSVDWEALAELGPEPRVAIETERGELVIRLLPEEAPLSVQSFVEEVRRGAHEGVQFHRVVPNFVIQAGDYSLGDGSGDVDYRIRSEFTQLPFVRGVLGMASAGKDTEGSQFFLAHSAQPHLESGYTAFGWLESGAEALDRIGEGDRIVSTRLLEPGGS